MFSQKLVCVTLVLTLVFAGACAAADSPSQAKVGEWTPLFDGKTLGKWKSTKFGGEGDVVVKDGKMVLEFGNDMTGVTWSDKKSIPTINYEIELEAQRINGSDFFCGLTFPVNEKPCSLILGGWGGGVCGLSSIDGLDASENQTTTYQGFKNGQWYKVRLRVTDAKIEAWLDKEKIVDQPLKGRKLSIRYEVDLSRPLGFSTWQTSAGLRKIRMRKVDPKALAKEAKDKP